MFNLTNKPNKNSVLIGTKNGKAIWQDTTTLRNINSIIVTNSKGDVLESIDLVKNERVPERFIPER